MPIVYVDSASTDDSVALARGMGADVVELDMSKPFSAARARNEGFERLMRIAPDVCHVQFVDGDCEVVADWIDRAAQTLESRTDVAVVCGRRRERFPERSLYNRIADIEWNTPAGEVKSCGGDALMRVAAFQQVKGYDSSVVAGEEPELCQRLRERGWKVLRIDAEMTVHDSAMLRFGQWWRRTVRSGYGAADVFTRFGQHGLFAKHVKSARLWGLTMPAAAVAILLAATLASASRHHVGGAALCALILCALLLLAYPLQMLRTAWGVRRRAQSRGDAVAYGILTMIGKWANVIGQHQYARDRAAGKVARTIEYKGAGRGQS
jgi:cellulose synthase/poly-beta-1,6-N-acetylglucosamine synthase-like glycosyltransferase